MYMISMHILFRAKVERFEKSYDVVRFRHFIFDLFTELSTEAVDKL